MKEEKLKYKLDLSTVDKKEFKKINCPSCSSEIPASDININDKIAKCSSCNALFSILGDLNELLQNEKPRQEVLRPEGIDLFYFKDELDITIQQSISPMETIMLMLFPVFAGITTLGASRGKITWIIPIILFILSMIPVISILFKKRHKIFVGIDDEFLTVQWRPKFLNRDKKIKVEDIDQVFITKAEGYLFVNLQVDQGAGQKNIKILSYLTNQTKAKFLEQEIEKYLGIENVPVLGEYK